MSSELLYHAPQSVPAAIALLVKASASGQGARLLAGGTAMVPEIKESLRAPAHLISLRRISELKRITLDGDVLRIGSMVTISELLQSTIIPENAPVLAQAAGKVAGMQVRNLATIGGSLCNAAPYADLATPCIILDATVQLQSASGKRMMPVTQFFTGPGQAALGSEELVTGITIPLTQVDIPAVYQKLTLAQTMEIGIVNVALALKLTDGICDDVRLALGAVAATPMRALKAEAVLRGKRLTKGLINSAATKAAEECRPNDDIRGSAWYRRRMVKVLTERAVLHLMSES